jgi:hypothetical protein
LTVMPLFGRRASSNKWNKGTLPKSLLFHLPRV